MAFDYKKEYKEFYLPKNKPQIITIPEMHFVAVRGKGNPNDVGEYQAVMEILYGMAFTIKMSKMGDHRIEGYFDYVVPPLEGFWWQEGTAGIDYSRKEDFCWISMIRLPEFVTEEEFHWAMQEAARKKKKDFSKAEFFTYDEGLCVQCMHLGAYDDEPQTLALMNAYAREQGYEQDLSATRFHHEIYLSDARRVPPERRKTVLRVPVKVARGE